MKKLIVLVSFIVLCLLNIKFPAQSRSIDCKEASHVSSSLQQLSHQFIPYSFFDEGKWGLVKEDGSLLTETSFDSIDDFSDGRAKFKNSSGQYGYFDVQGKIVVPAKFDEAERFHEGLAAVKLNGRWGYINHTGQVIFPFKLFYAGPFSNKRAFISTGKTRDGKLQYGVIDNYGNFIFKEMFDYYSKFIDGVALVNSKENHYVSTFLLKENGEIKEVKNVYAVEYSQYSNGLIPVISIKPNWILDTLDRLLSESRSTPLSYGFIDKNGEFLIQPRFLDASQFKSCVASVKSDDVWGLIDTKGDFILKPQFKNKPQYLGEGLIKVNTEFKRIESDLGLDTSGRRTGISLRYSIKDRLMDLNGNWITPAYDNFGTLSEGMISFQVGEKWGFLSRKGEIVIPPKFDSVSDFKYGRSRVLIDGKSRYINFSGKYLPDPNSK
jgi:hypothetical protein